MELINNTTKTLKDDLSVEIKQGSKLSIAAACFSIYAFQELKAQLSQIDELRFIFTSPIAAIYRGNIPFIVIFPCEIAPCILPEIDIFQIVVVKISVAGSNGGVAIVRGNGRHSQKDKTIPQQHPFIIHIVLIPHTPALTDRQQAF